MTEVELRRPLRERGLERVADALLRRAAPAIRIIERATVEEKIPVGASKLGGRPDLAPGLPVFIETAG